MGKTTHDDPLKKVLAEIAEQVSGLPEHLQQAAFTTLLNRALDSQQPKRVSGKAHPPVHHPPSHSATPPASTFGDYYGSFPSELTIDDQLLIAGSFAETQSDDRTFTIDAAHDLLKGIGIKLSNPTVYAKRLKGKRLIITVGKVGKRSYKCRLSPDGHKALRQLKEATK
jgi:hypothetical protein